MGAEVVNVVDYAVLTVGTTAVDLLTDASPTVPRQAKRIFITCEDHPVAWRADGTAPTATAGHLLAAADSLSLTGANYRQLLDQIEFIATANATLRITYFD